jgi:DNA-binding XRE family transcriptional regulator
MADGAPTSYAELLSVLDALPILLRENRRRTGMSLRSAAREIGVSFATISRLEDGNDASLTNAMKVIAWLGGHPIPGATPRRYTQPVRRSGDALHNTSEETQP